MLSFIIWFWNNLYLIFTIFKLYHTRICAGRWPSPWLVEWGTYLGFQHERHQHGPGETNQRDETRRDFGVVTPKRWPVDIRWPHVALERRYVSKWSRTWWSWFSKFGISKKELNGKLSTFNFPHQNHQKYYLCFFLIVYLNSSKRNRSFVENPLWNLRIGRHKLQHHLQRRTDGFLHLLEVLPVASEAGLAWVVGELSGRAVEQKKAMASESSI